MLLVGTQPGARAPLRFRIILGLNHVEFGPFRVRNRWAAGEPLAVCVFHAKWGGSATGGLGGIVDFCIRDAGRPTPGVVAPVLYG